MLPSKSKLAVCSSSSVSSALFFPASTTSSNIPLSTYAPPPRLRGRLLSSPSTQWRPSRQYATVRDDPADQVDDPPVPSWPTSKNPTPYEIFDQAKSDPYNKKTFHQLVKLYHPDRHQHTSHLHGMISQAAKTERYRLIVTANDILSDPAKRRVYDLYGTGWGGQGDMRNSFREAEKAWRSQPDSAANNATWEDWERWHARQRQKRDGKGQDPVYDSSNHAFTFMIVVLLLVATFGRATMSFHVADIQDKQLKAAGGDMRQIRERKALLTREDRVESFIREREWAQIEPPINDSDVRRK